MARTGALSTPPVSVERLPEGGRSGRTAATFLGKAHAAKPANEPSLPTRWRATWLRKARRNRVLGRKLSTPVLLRCAYTFLNLMPVSIEPVEKL